MAEIEQQQESQTPAEPINREARHHPGETVAIDGKLVVMRGPRLRRQLTFKQMQEGGHPYTRTHTWRMVKSGRFPAPTKADGGRINLWYEDEVIAYWAERSAAR